MKHWNRADLGLLGPTLLSFGQIALLLGIVYGATAYVATTTAAKRQAAESELLQMRSRYISLGQARQTFRTYQGRFQALHEAGVINDEPRLAWIESVQYSAENLGLRSVTFSLEPTAPLVLEHPVVAAPLAASRMKLQFDLVHEGELIAFLQRLHAVAPAIFWTRYCDLDRGEGFAPFAAGRKNLSAQCELMWITVHTEPIPEVTP